MEDLEYHVGDLGHYHVSKEKAIRFLSRKCTGSDRSIRKIMLSGKRKWLEDGIRPEASRAVKGLLQEFLSERIQNSVRIKPR